jgi:O-Antigen ligase
MAKHEFPRLKLFTYEASYYSLLLVPIVYYYVFKFLFKQIEQYRFLTMFIVLVPVLMSMSFGVIGSTFLTACILAFVFREKLLKYRRPFLITLTILVALILTFVVLLIFFPKNPFSLRMYSIFEGTDTSANGRTTDSFNIAWKLIKDKNSWFGIGLGQIKIQVEALVREFFSYWGNYPRYDIPNAMGETLAIFGIFGVLIRLGLEWYLFFKTNVKTNYYRLALFIFVFIYQFTGSFITNIVEYVIWILAFSQVFEQFNVKQKQT